MKLLKELNSDLEGSAVLTMMKAMLECDEQMKKEGIYNEVVSTMERFSDLTDPETKRAFTEEMSARLKKGDRVAEYCVMGVIWPQLKESWSSLFIRQMSLVYLVAQFESFLQSVISLSLKKRPNILQDRMVAFKELLSSESVENVRTNLIEQEATDRMNDGIDGLAQYLSGLWNVRLFDYEKWP